MQTQTDADRSRYRDKDKTKKTDRHRSISQEPREHASNWLKIYIKETTIEQIDFSSPAKQRILRNIIRAGEVKLQWRIEEYAYEKIHAALIDGRIPLRPNMFIRVKGAEWNQIKSCYKP